MTSNQLRAFFTEAAQYLATPRFQAAEVDYKTSLQGELRPAIAAYLTARDIPMGTVVIPQTTLS